MLLRLDSCFHTHINTHTQIFFYIVENFDQRQKLYKIFTHLSSRNSREINVKTKYSETVHSKASEEIHAWLEKVL